MSATDEKVAELNRKFLEFMNTSENVDSAAKSIYEDLLDEVLMGFVFDMHRVTKTGSSDIEEGVPDDESYAIVDLPGMDVFGQHPIKKSQECTCPNCDRGVAACRFATHLEKCMGMGRNSSRIASRRIAKNTNDTTTFTGITVSDDEDDVDWNLNTDKRKRKKDRNGFKKLKQPKMGPGQKNGDSNSTGTTGEFISTSNESSPSNFENMTIEDKRTLLSQICGVISEHTKKMCTRSTRCPQHTDDQRKEMRASHLDSGTGGAGPGENVHIDIDTFEESDSQNLRDTIARWDQENSSHSSPADSASTTSTSSNSKKKEPKSKGRGKGSKRDRSSPVSQGD